MSIGEGSEGPMKERLNKFSKNTANLLKVGFMATCQAIKACILMSIGEGSEGPMKERLNRLSKNTANLLKVGFMSTCHVKLH
jgi:hypothetical protein